MRMPKKNQEKKIPSGQLSKWVIISFGLAVLLLPLMLVSPALRQMLLHKNERRGSLRVTRSRLTDRVVAIMVLERQPIAEESALKPLQRLLEVFAQAAGEIDAFVITERWRDTDEQVKATEIKRKVFAAEAMDALYGFWHAAVDAETGRIMEIQPRGVSFFLKLSLNGSGTPRLAVEVTGDSEAVERFGEYYLSRWQ